MTLRGLVGRDATIGIVEDLLSMEGSWNYIVEDRDLCGILVRSVSQPWSDYDRDHFINNHYKYRRFLRYGGVLFPPTAETTAEKDDNKDDDFSPSENSKSKVVTPNARWNLGNKHDEDLEL